MSVSAVQERVLAGYDRQEMLELAMELARIPSFTTRETPVAEFLAAFLGKRGFGIDMQEVEAGRFQCIAHLRGVQEAPSLMLNGHTDVDPLTLGWRRDPWRPGIEGDRLYGHGLINMKGGVAAMIEAALSLQRAGIPLRGSVVIAAVVGELQGGVGTVHLLERGLRTDAAIVTEPYGAHNVITVHSGRWQGAITLYGKALHHMQREDAADAIAAMADVIREAREVRFSGGEWSKVPGIPRLNIGSVIGGHGPELDVAGAYYVADVCTAVVDVRFGPAQSPGSIASDLGRAVERALAGHPGVTYEITSPPPVELRNGRHVFPVFDLPLDEAIVGIVSRNVKAVTGQPPAAIGVHIPGSRASDDTGHLWQAGIPCLLYGPAAPPDASESDGFVLISEMEICAKVLALSALEFVG
jgi:acetylornithine deacetylase